MKNLVIALSVALAATLSGFGAAQAASVVVTDGDMPMHHHDHEWHHRDWHHHCMVKTVESHHHGHTVIKKTRVCR